MTALPLARPQTLADITPLYNPEVAPLYKPTPFFDEAPTPTVQVSAAADGTPKPRGRRRAQQDTAWNKATGAFQAIQRATADLTRRALPIAAPSAAARQLSIVVRPLSSPRDALAEQLPAARRAAGVVRDWVLADDGAPPATGAHRAPGTLPIESWLLIGRQRQQALLAALVAAGVLLVMVPGQQRPDISAVNASDRSVAVTEDGQGAGNRPGSQPAGSTKAPQQSTPDATAENTAPVPAGSAPAPPVPATSSPTEPGDASAATVDPRANGPAHSLRRTGSAVVALTFDDGPDPVQTPRLLELLAKHQVKATFCLVGERAQAHPELVRDIVAQGHTLCNHSWDHSFEIGEAKREDIRKDLEATNRAIRVAVPDAAIPYFRAPGGIFTTELVSVADEYRMTSLYWEVDPRDWDQPEAEDDAAHVERVVAQVKKEVRPGSIVLSHDFNQAQTIVAYEQLLPWLIENFELGLPSPG